MLKPPSPGSRRLRGSTLTVLGKWPRWAPSLNVSVSVKSETKALASSIAATAGHRWRKMEKRRNRRTFSSPDLQIWTRALRDIWAADFLIDGLEMGEAVGVTRRWESGTRAGLERLLHPILCSDGVSTARSSIEKVSKRRSRDPNGVGGEEEVILLPFDGGRV